MNRNIPLKLKKIAYLFYIITSVCILVSFSGVFYLSQMKSFKIRELEGSVNYFESHPTYLVYDTERFKSAGLIYTIDSIIYRGDTISSDTIIRQSIKNMRKEQSTYEIEGVSSIRIGDKRFDTIKLEIQNAKKIAAIIAEERKNKKNHINK